MEKVKRSRQKKAEWLRSLKNHPCQDCGGTFIPEAMHWDHRDPTSKLFGVANANQNNVSKARILAEIAKCDLVCANCHAARTFLPLV